MLANPGKKAKNNRMYMSAVRAAGLDGVEPPPRAEALEGHVRGGFEAVDRPGGHHHR